MSPPQRQPLLGDGDLAPAQVVHESGRANILLVGDHAGNAIPSALGDLGLSIADRTRHIAWDLGVRALGEHMAAALDATFIHQHFSRLVIDCNRDPRSTASILEVSDETIVPGNARLGADAHEERRVAIHEPYHQRIASEFARREGAEARPVLVALHSFTPMLGKTSRPWQLGILHDRGDTRLSHAMLKRLRQEESLTVGDNEPYRMDDTDYTVARHAYENKVPYLEVEFRQDLLAQPDDVRLWASRFARWLSEAIASLFSPNLRVH
jgi:predicted N-formylglutamate amidohydrolase